VEPLSPARYKVCFTAGAELRDKLERLQALMRSSVPDGDLAEIIDLAVTEKLERLEAKRFAKTKARRKGLAQTDTTPKSRYIPAAVRRFVEKRDGGRCTYRDKQGRRCPKRHDLEFHHLKPFGRGGHHSPEGLALACRTHNQERFPEPSLGGGELCEERRGSGSGNGSWTEPLLAPRRRSYGEMALMARRASWLEERGGGSGGRLDEGCERQPLPAGRQTA
jgi:hypothetical protein